MRRMRADALRVASFTPRQGPIGRTVDAMQRLR
jgi:hypothetical protein